MKVNVIKVKNKDAKDGYMLINESDFNDKEHELFKEKAKAKPKAKAKKVAKDVE